MIYMHLVAIFGYDIANKIQGYIFDFVLADIKRQKLLSDIRGERYVYLDNHTMIHCIECYTSYYDNMSTCGIQDKHLKEKHYEIGNDKILSKISYLSYLARSPRIHYNKIYITNRIIQSEVIYYSPNLSMVEDHYYYKNNIDHLHHSLSGWLRFMLHPKRNKYDYDALCHMYESYHTYDQYSNNYTEIADECTNIADNSIYMEDECLVEDE